MENMNSDNSGNQNQQTVKRKVLPILMALGFVAVILLVVVTARQANRLASLKSSADCSEPECRPSVILSGREFGYGSNLSMQSGSLTARSGQPLELTWVAQNVDMCRADGNWTPHAGVVYPPTALNRLLNKSERFSVTCYVDNQPVATSSLEVIVLKND